MRFEWDARKAELNARKHDVTFEEAQTAFFDEAGLVKLSELQLILGASL